jgi:hypothetical protein
VRDPPAVLREQAFGGPGHDNVLAIGRSAEPRLELQLQASA